MARANSKKTAVKKPVAGKAAAKKPVSRTAAHKPKTERTAISQDHMRNVFLAGLGLYGKAFDEAQNQIKENYSKLEQRREKASELFEELVKRGEKVESNTRKKLKRLELSEFYLSELKLSDCEDPRAELRARLDKARDSFNTLREAVSTKSGAA